MVNKANNEAKIIEEIKRKRESGTLIGLASMYENLASIRASNGNILSAIDSSMTGLSIAKNIDDRIIECRLLYYIAKMWRNVGAFKKAYEYVSESIKISNTINLKDDNDSLNKLLVMQQVLQGRCSVEIGNRKQAQECYNTIMTFGDGIEMTDNEIFSVYTFMAYFNCKYGQMIKVSEHIRDIEMIPIINVNYSEVESDMEDYYHVLFDSRDEKHRNALVKYLQDVVDSKDLALKVRMNACMTVIKYQKASGEDESVYCKKYYQFAVDQRMNDMASIRESMEIRERLEDTTTKEKKSFNEARTDVLTNLHNKLFMETYIANALSLAIKNKKKIGIEMMDIDNFKQVNDTYGHDAGDECLKKVAKRLKDMEMPGKVTPIRCGGDEFIIVYEDVEDSDVKTIMKQLKDDIEEMHINNAKATASKYVTISQGCFNIVPGYDSTPAGIIKEADNILYQVKKKKNSYGFSNGISVNILE